MSTITETEPVVQTPGLGWVPSPGSLYRLSIEQYEAMVASGVFTKRDRFHLINGFLVAKMTEYPPHSAASEATRLVIEPLLPTGWHPRSDKPLRIPNYASVPEPDLVIARGTVWDYQDRHPEPANVALVAEVANSSLSEDRAMAGIYGKGGVPVYWIVNLIDRQVEVHTNPGPGGYGSRQIFKPGEEIPVVIDGIERGRIAVADIMPRTP
jgi:Uma2 family endonuclease